jgi:hypothetical protein
MVLIPARYRGLMDGPDKPGHDGEGLLVGLPVRRHRRFACIFAFVRGLVISVVNSFNDLVSWGLLGASPIIKKVFSFEIFEGQGIRSRQDNRPSVHESDVNASPFFEVMILQLHLKKAIVTD